MEYTFFDRFRHQSGVHHCITRRDLRQPLEGSMALHTGQDASQVLANRAQAATYFGREAHFVSALQVHGDYVHVVTESASRGWDAADTEFKADAMVTNLPDVVLTILTADCVPILLYDPIHRAIGAVHAGWRGTQQEIARKTIEMMHRQYGTRTADLIVGIGPAIGGCCYEVGAEVADCFTDYPKALSAKKNGKYLLDTKQVNAEQLRKLGIPEEQIEVSPVCTMCEHERFFSYRADAGTAGRFMSCISLTKNGV